jgi:hypothetical protein
MLRKTLVARISRTWIYLQENTISDPECLYVGLYFGFVKLCPDVLFPLARESTCLGTAKLSATLIDDNTSRGVGLTSGVT